MMYCLPETLWMMVKALNVLNAMNPERWPLLHIRSMIGVADIVANGNRGKNNMSIKRYNFNKPKINRQELELLNFFLARTDDNPLINPKALELFKANGYSAKNYQDLVNKVKTILKTYKTKGEL
jgi:hypothetical protein